MKQTSFLNQTKNKPKSFRLQQKFWLDLSKPEEAGLADICDSLKQNRTFSKTIRDGIRLIVSLRQGKTDVLEELFPAIVIAIRGSQSTVNDDFQSMMNEIAELKSLVSSQPVSQPRAIQVPEGGELEVVEAATGDAIVSNFLSGFDF